MTELQRTIAATFATLFFVAALFFIPWKRADTGELRWAPFYRNPITYESTFDGSATTNRFAKMKGHRMPGLYFLQLALIGGTGFLIYKRVGQNA